MRRKAEDRTRLIDNAKLLVRIRNKRDSLVAQELKSRLRDIESGRDNSSFKYELDSSLRASIKQTLDKLLGDFSGYNRKAGELTSTVEAYVTDAVTAKLVSLLPSESQIATMAQSALDSTIARAVQRILDASVDSYVKSVMEDGLLRELNEAEQEAKAAMADEETPT